jgi:nifR3 family TIM-barrel protein
MSLLPKRLNGCPYLFLAPMEGVADACFRKAMGKVGGFDAAVRDFLRVPKNAHVKSLATQYNSEELGSTPLFAQLMGADPDLVAEMGLEMERRKAPRIDFNCGCPSNRVNGRQAGSSLLKDPDFLHTMTKTLVSAVSIPVSVKIRSGYADTSLFKENLLAIEEAGAKYITLHPRTKIEGYSPPANWDLIKVAKSTVNIPIVGNGDILTVGDALRMLAMTKCDALMIGRGSIINPFIFHQIYAHFSSKTFVPKWSDYLVFFKTYFQGLDQNLSDKSKVNKLKQLFGFVFKKTPTLLEKRIEVLRAKQTDPKAFLDFSLSLLKQDFSS